jgi:hypothetical protein
MQWYNRRISPEMVRGFFYAGAVKSCVIMRAARVSVAHLAWDGQQASLSGLPIPAKLTLSGADFEMSCVAGRL